VRGGAAVIVGGSCLAVGLEAALAQVALGFSSPQLADDARAAPRLLQVNITVDEIKKLGLKNQAVDFRQSIDRCGLPVRNQANRGTCTIFASTFLIEYMTCKRARATKYPGNGLDFSEEYLNAAANRASGTKIDGSNFQEAAPGYAQFGIVIETKSPYKSVFDPNYLQGSDKATMDLLNLGKTRRLFNPRVTLSVGHPGLSSQQLAVILHKLDQGIPVAIGFRGDNANAITVTLPNGFQALSDLGNKNPKSEYAHTVPLVGYALNTAEPSKSYFVYRNSAGSAFGDKGYGYMTVDYAKKFVYDFMYLEPRTVLSKPPIVARELIKPRPPFVREEGLQRLHELTRRI
jgi:C1A family cysteine protease